MFAKLIMEKSVWTTQYCAAIAVSGGRTVSLVTIIIVLVEGLRLLVSVAQQTTNIARGFGTQDLMLTLMDMNIPAKECVLINQIRCSLLTRDVVISTINLSRDTGLPGAVEKEDKGTFVMRVPLRDSIPMQKKVSEASSLIHITVKVHARPPPLLGLNVLLVNIRISSIVLPPASASTKILFVTIIPIQDVVGMMKELNIAWKSTSRRGLSSLTEA